MLVTSQGHGTGRAAVRAGRYALICKVCVYFHFERFHPRVFFLSVSLWWVTSTPSSLRLHFCSHVSWPNLFFLQPCLIWYLFKKKSFPLCNILALFFHLLLFALAFGCFLLKDTDNTCWQHRTPIFLQFLQPAVVSYRKKPPCPRLHSWKRPCVVTLKAELWASSDSCEKGAAADGKTCISKPLRGF